METITSQSGQNKKIPLMRPYFDDEELTEIKKVLDSGWVSQGPKTKEFEERAASYLGVKHAVAVSNCTAALHLALLASGIKKGDEVLVADYTYPATGHSVVYCGARPVFVDVDIKTYNIDPENLKKKLSKKTKAIIPVHTFGQPADMDPILEFAGAHGLAVIEDAACAFGAKYKNRLAGTMSQIGCFSFHARKGLTTGEGGMAVTNDLALANKMRKLSVFGITGAWEREKTDGFFIPEFTEIGFNYKMSDVTAAIGIVQLRRLEAVLKRKRVIAKYWDGKLADFNLISPPFVSNEVEHAYQTYVALAGEKVNRNKLIENLAKRNVQAQIGTYASHIQPVYKSRDWCPNSLDIFNRATALPLFYALTEGDIDVAAAALRAALEESI